MMVRKFKYLFSTGYLSSIFYLTRLKLLSSVKSSYLGMLWTVIQPLSTVFIYAFVIGKIFRFAQPDYPFFLISGTLPWIFISSSIMIASQSLIAQREAFLRCIVPKTIFPAHLVFYHYYNFAVGFLGSYAFALMFYTDFHMSIFFLPIATIPMLIFALSIGIAVSYITPYIRDLSEFIPICINIFFWMTPILYTKEAIHEKYHYLLLLHPLYLIIDPVRTVIYYHKIPSIFSMSLAFAVALISAVFGYFIYTKLKREVVWYI